MAQATGRWGEVIQTANDWLKQQTEPQQKIRLCLHLAKWYGDDLGHPEYAQPYYAQIVQLDPNNVGALRQMGQLYRKSANWQQLGATLTRALDVAVTDLDRKEILTELGELLDGQMSQTDQAIAYFKRALEVDAQFIPALENLERIYARAAAEPRARRRPHAQGPGAHRPARDREHQAAHRRRSTRRASAIRRARRRSYREVVEVDAANLQALRGLARVYEVLEQWPRARARSSRASSTS